MKKNKSININKISVILLIIIVISIIFIIANILNSKKDIQNNEEIKKYINEINTSVNANRIDKLKKIQNENEDIIGWLEIPNTTINYPVLQCENNEFYMNHNYKKEKSKDGSLFLDKAYDWNKPSENLLIYGHNNTNSKEMFSELINYKDEEYYKKHKTIRFTTDTEDSEYEIISVFLSRVYYTDEKDVFRYYYFVNAKNENEFYDYVKNAKKSSLYEIEETAEYGEQLITLSTCYYYTEDGRFVVVAKKK